MFVGALPKPVLQQVAKVLDGAPLPREAYVCCSGSFRLEQTLSQLSPDIEIHGNDVSLVTCAVGTLAATGACFPMRFHGELEGFEVRLAGATDLERVAAVLVAGQMSRFTGKNEFARLHREHYLNAFQHHLGGASKKLLEILAGFRMKSFRARDFIEHSKEGAARSALVMGFPPTYKSGYENLYKFLDRNIEWTQPAYELFDPKNVGQWVEELHASGTPYVVGCDREIPSLRPVGSYLNPGKHTLFIYARGTATTHLRATYTLKPFRYAPIDAAKLTAKSEVALVPVGASEMNFLKEQYLARNIVHTAGQLNFLVYVDSMLVGGFIYTRSKFDPMRTLYVLSDFSISRERKLSKLVAMRREPRPRP